MSAMTFRRFLAGHSLDACALLNWSLNELQWHSVAFNFARQIPLPRTEYLAFIGVFIQKQAFLNSNPIRPVASILWRLIIAVHSSFNLPKTISLSPRFIQNC